MLSPRFMNGVFYVHEVISINLKTNLNKFKLVIPIQIILKKEKMKLIYTYIKEIQYLH